MHTKEGLGALTGGDNVCTGFDGQFRWCACVRVCVSVRGSESEREREGLRYVICHGSGGRRGWEKGT